LVVGAVGVGIAAGVGAGDIAGSSLGGAAAAVGAGLCYGAAFVYMRRHLISLPALVAATGQLTAGSALALPLALVAASTEGVSLTLTRATALALLGVVGTGIAYVINYRLIADLGATRASVVTYAIPVVAVAVGIAFLDEEFALRQLIGAVLIFAGIRQVRPRTEAPGPVALDATSART
jgi:drug/metabolite transporter (DMT)-like permease